MPTQAQEVYDVTGAGDTGLASWRQRWLRVIRWKKPASCQCGGRRGGRQTGDIHGFADELENAVRGRADTGFGVMTEGN